MGHRIGIDVGSVSVNCLVIDDEGRIVHEAPYRRHFGLVLEETRKVLEQVSALFPPGSVASLTFTGVHGRPLAEMVGAPYEVETIAQILGAVHVAPGVRTIISVGGQDACLFQLDYHGEAWHLASFTMNGPCASGTGSFIDQQAERLASSLYGADFHFSQEQVQKTLEDFIALGMQSGEPAPVACRCTVFTKSDMIHLQNKGEPLANIIAGLHQGSAANYVSTIVSSRTLAEPVVFIGGVASNPLQVKAFRRYYPRLAVPPHHASLGALGAALQAARSSWDNGLDLSGLSGRRAGGSDIPRAERLELLETDFDPDNSLEPMGEWPREAYLGLDVGSTTTKYALTDLAGRIIAKRYVQTRGKPIEVTRELMGFLRDEVAGRTAIMGIATTGSGRNVVGDFLEADLVIDEITAHARGAVEVDPRVDTIFEIGGQDSKYISVERTHPLDFDMNKVCAAGTGSFLHELANKMRINIAGEFQAVALSAAEPVCLAERCTVFMESDLQSYLQRGAGREDLMAGLCYAIVHNYLNRVVGKRRVGRRVMFLGGPSLNRGVVAAFEKVLGRGLVVPRHREVLGARGAALALADRVREGTVTRREHDLGDLASSEVAFAESVCRADRKCHNECKLKIYSFGGRKSVWGGECGRYEVKEGREARRPDLFAERRELFQERLEGRATAPGEPPGPGSGPTVGIPLALHSLDWGILWVHLFSELGWRVVLTRPTDQKTVLAGVESMTAETCFPVKVFHGHVRQLESQADYLFLPNVIDMPTPDGGERGLFCPFVQGSQYMARAALRLPDRLIIRPSLRLKGELGDLAGALRRALPPGLRPSRGGVGRAVRAAWMKQLEFRRALRERGAAFLAGTPPEEPVWLVSGRPYNMHDERLNLQIGRQLSKLGIRAMPLDHLELDPEDLSDFPNMYWGLGSRILRAARRVARTPGLFGVHLTNFGCGPDSFLEHFYRHVMGEKPALILELDEHSAVAGMLTRLEAYRNVVANVRRAEEAPCRN